MLFVICTRRAEIVAENQKHFSENTRKKEEENIGRCWGAVPPMDPLLIPLLDSLKTYLLYMDILYIHYTSQYKRPHFYNHANWLNIW